jgi:hypothetical protein
MISECTAFIYTSVHLSESEPLRECSLDLGRVLINKWGPNWPFLGYNTRDIDELVGCGVPNNKHETLMHGLEVITTLAVWIIATFRLTRVNCLMVYYLSV